MADRRSFTIRSDDHPDCTLYASGEVDAAVLYCQTYDYAGQVTVESNSHYVTFDVEFLRGLATANELDREQK
jgi:hypothetical protein